METKQLEITKEDRDLLVAGLRSVRLTGTLETLSKGMERVFALMKKVQDTFGEEDNGITERSGETD